ncbi:MAG: hypothetical protein RLZZ480_557 [Candidatus Parcubacteria bacterium]|jgi:hypothetical protein
MIFQTQRFILACLALFLGVGLGVFIANIIETGQNDSVVTVEQETNYDPTVREFKNGLAVFLNIKHHRTLKEATPEVLLGAFPSLKEEDFNGVETNLGVYEYKDGVLAYSNTEVVDGAADVITDAGMKTLRDNIYRRFAFPPEKNIIDIVDELTKLPPQTAPSSAPSTTASSTGTICTLDAKVCPDGTAVGRSGPNCEFAACPSEPTKVPEHISCTPEQKSAEACIELYAPVCASVQIQCITTPCEPIQKTYPNSCFACKEHSVDSYTEGACAGDEVVE